MLENKKIMVLGAGGLLGSQVVKRLLSLGAQVVAVDMQEDFVIQRLQSIGGNMENEMLEIGVANVTSESDLKNLFGNSVGLTGLVNCTYPKGSAYGKHFFDVTTEGFNENVSLHLGSAFLVMQQSAHYFMQHKEKISVVNISSIYGVVAPDFDVYKDTSMTMPVEYAAIKAAIIHLSKYVARYVKDSRFRINSISPGGIYDKQSVQFVENYRNKTFGKGMLDVADVIGPIVFLLSDCSEFMNGQNLVIDDGFSI